MYRTNARALQHVPPCHDLWFGRYHVHSVWYRFGYSTTEYHVPAACSFSPARARILGHACSTDSGQSGEDVFASLDGRHTCIPYPTVVSLRNCGTPLLGPTHSTCAPPTCTLNIDFERPTMPLQVYKESRPFDFCSLSYSSAQVQK